MSEHDEEIDPGLVALFDELDRRAAAGENVSNKTDLARAIKTSKQTVSQWRRVPVYPVNRVLQIERLIDLPRWKMRPDIYAPPPSTSSKPGSRPKSRPTTRSTK